MTYLFPPPKSVAEPVAESLNNTGRVIHYVDYPPRLNSATSLPVQLFGPIKPRRRVISEPLFDGHHHHACNNPETTDDLLEGGDIPENEKRP